MAKHEKHKRIFFAECIKNTTENVKISFDYKSISSKDVFMVTGTKGSKPDILIQKKIDNNNWNIVVEFKSGKLRELVKAYNQIQKYALDYQTGKAKYFVNGKEIKIHSFLVSTPLAEDSFLFEKEEKQTPIKSDFIPFTERPMSFLYWRMLYTEQQKHNLSVKLGILLFFDEKPYVIQENKFIPL